MIMMSHHVHYDHQFTKALGRNGIMHCTGIELAWDDELLRISPLHTRGTGACFIEVPIKDLNKTIKALQDCKESLKKIGVDCG